jgi:hypothetical protein
MKKFICWLLVISITGCTGGQVIPTPSPDCITIKKEKKDKKKEVDIIYKNEYIGSMTYIDYQTLVKSTAQLAELRKAEEKKNIIIELADDPWKVDVGKRFTTTMKVKWFNENKEVIKEMKIGIDIKKTSEDEAVALTIYYKISAIGFPVSVIVAGLLFLLLIRGGAGK